MLAAQRRNLAELSFRIASMLPDDPKPLRPTPALSSLARQNRASRARTLATSVGRQRRPLGAMVGTAAVAAIAFALLASRPQTLSPVDALAAPITTNGLSTTTAAAATTPKPAPTVQPGILEQQRIVTMYGHPHATTMGLLGTFEDPSAAAREVKHMAAEAQAADGRPTIGALHVIVHVAQATPTDDGTLLARIGPEDLEPWVAAARDQGVLLILDTQIGWSDALTETKRLEQWLKLPFVHLALDPEFSLKRGVASHEAIGSLDGASVNAVQAYLGDLVRREGLPRKMLMLHQFVEHMLTNTTYAADPDIEIVVDFDGYGSIGAKIEGYSHYAVAPYSERPAMKLFTEHDTPMMRPNDIPRLLRERAEALNEAVPRPPDVIVYQ